MQQLQAFRKGAPQSQVMSIIVGNLRDRDIEDLAAYLESPPPGGIGE